MTGIVERITSGDVAGIADITWNDIQQAVRCTGTLNSRKFKGHRRGQLFLSSVSGKLSIDDEVSTTLQWERANGRAKPAYQFSDHGKLLKRLKRRRTT